MALTQQTLNAAQNRSIHINTDTIINPNTSYDILEIINCENSPVIVGMSINDCYFKIEIVSGKIISLVSINNAANVDTKNYGFKIGLASNDNAKKLVFRVDSQSTINSLDIEWNYGYFSILLRENNFNDSDFTNFITITNIPAGDAITQIFSESLIAENISSNSLTVRNLEVDEFTVEKIKIGNWKFETEIDGNNTSIVLKYEEPAQPINSEDPPGE